MTARPATVLYASRYGRTARHARTLAARLGTTAEELDGPVAPVAGSDGVTVDRSAPVVVLTPVYVSRPLRRRRVLATLNRSGRSRRPVAVVLVGLSPVDDEARLATAHRILSAIDPASTVEVFHLRGAYDPVRLGTVDRLLMAVMRRRLRSSTDLAARAIVAGEPVDLVDDDALDPIVQWAQRVSAPR